MNRLLVFWWYVAILVGGTWLILRFAAHLGSVSAAYFAGAVTVIFVNMLTDAAHAISQRRRDTGVDR